MTQEQKVQALLGLLALAVLVVLLTGCSGLKQKFEVRVATTVDCTEAHVISKWWLFSLGTQIADPDARVLARAACRTNVPLVPGN